MDEMLNKQPPELPPSPPPTNYQHGYFKDNWKKMLLVFIVIDAVILGALYYFVIAKQGSNPQPVAKTVSPSPSTASNPTSGLKSSNSTITRTAPTPVANPNMKIYTTNYGFYFQYPKDFILNNTSTPARISFLQQQNDIKAQRLLVEITTTTESLEDFADDQQYLMSEDFPVTQEPQIIDGHQALALTKTFSMQDICGTGSSDQMKRTGVLLVKGSSFITAFIVNDSCYTLANDWFSQIPPTIKFTK